MPDALETIVDLDRYPILDLGAPEARALIERAKTELAIAAAINLFPERISTLCVRAAEVESRWWRRGLSNDCLHAGDSVFHLLVSKLHIVGHCVRWCPLALRFVPLSLSTPMLMPDLQPSRN